MTPRPKPFPRFRRWHAWLLAFAFAYAGGALALLDTGNPPSPSDFLRILFFAIPALLFVLPLRKLGSENAWDWQERALFGAGVWLGTAGCSIAAILFWLNLPMDEAVVRRWSIAPVLGAAVMLVTVVVRDNVRERWARRVIAEKEPDFGTKSEGAGKLRPLFHGEFGTLAIEHRTKAGEAFREAPMVEPIASAASKPGAQAGARLAVTAVLVVAWAGILWWTRGPLASSSFEPPPRYTVQFPAKADAIEGIAMGNDAACAWDAKHAMFCWMEHDYRAEIVLGRENHDPPRSIAKYEKMQTPVADIAIGMSHTCTRAPDGIVRCGEKLVDRVPSKKIAAGGFDSCALDEDGVRCWSTGEFDGDRTPKRIAGTETAVDVAMGVDHACALLADKTVRCWGRNEKGQLGHAGEDPGAVEEISNVRAIALGWYRTFALLEDGTVRAWGDNENGALGDGTEHDRAHPIRVVDLDSVVALAAATHHTCALRSDGSVRCWGWNGTGALGDGTTRDRARPVLVPFIHAPLQIAAGGNSTCARFADRVECWGQNHLL